MKKKQYSPWIWIPSLCVAEEIPAAVVMFVAVLMFLQFGADEGMAALYSGLLFLPWVMKSYLYSKVRKAGSFKRRLHWVELTMFVCLMGIAVYISEAKVRAWLLFVFLYVLSCLCAWHELLSRMYYARMLEPREQRLYGNTKMVSSQMALVVTYGVLIIVAGFFEVFFRSYQKAWAMESSLVAGGFLVFCVLNLVVLPHLRVPQPYRYESVADTVKNEWHIVSRIRQKPHIFPILLSLFLQGTIGVLAFSIGIALGRALMRRCGNRSMFGMTAVVLTLSPVPYMLMARQPQLDNMFLLCCMTFVAQLFFGFGLNVCRVYVPYISEQRYRNVTNFLYLPMVASLMVVPMAVSGWLCSELGYSTFFKLCVAIAPLAWVLLALCKTKKYLLMGVDK